MFSRFKSVYNLFIQAKTTPNPNFLKFVPGGLEVMRTGTYDFARPRDAKISPLASQLFQIDGVTRVFYAKDYISVSKGDEYRWEELKPHIFAALNDHFTADSQGNEKALFVSNFEEAPDTVVNESDSEAVQLIKEIIDTRIRPNV